MQLILISLPKPNPVFNSRNTLLRVLTLPLFVFFSEMADHLAKIFGTEEDKVNCSFYLKIGACRHGDRCSRNHIRPTFSPTILIPHMYTPPPPDFQTGTVPDDSEHFREFYEEIIEELDKFGEIENLEVMENLGEHMFGNVYVKFTNEEEAEKCLQGLNGRYYAGRLLSTEYSTVTEFRDARCRQFDEGKCVRGSYCNFMHVKEVPGDLKRALRKLARKHRASHGGRSRSRSRHRGGGRRRGQGGRDDHRDRERRPSRGSSRDRGSSPGRDRAKEFQRGGSAERRSKIAAWNKMREKESGHWVQH